MSDSPRTCTICGTPITPDRDSERVRFADDEERVSVTRLVETNGHESAVLRR